MIPVDQFQDPTLALLINLVADRPKVAAAVADFDIQPDEGATLPDSAFAWPEKRAYAVHSREHTILSRVYREDASSVPKYVDEALKEACEMYNIPEELFAREKKATVEDNLDDYLLPSMKRLPVRSAEQVKTAEAKLLAGFQKLALEHRAEACKRLIDKAMRYGVTLDPFMHKLAGFTVTSTRQLTDWIEARTEAAPQAYKAAFQKLANAVKELPPEIRDRAQQIKLAETIGELDKKAGLVRHYDRKLPDALLTVFNTEKIAGHGVDLNGRFVPMDRLASYPATFYGDILGEDLVREASDGRGGLDPQKLAAILQTLPRDMKNILSTQMR